MWRNKVSLMAILVGTGLLAAGVAHAQSQNMNAPNATDIAKSPDIAPDQRVFRDNVYGRDARNRQPTKAQIATEVSSVFEKLQLSCNVVDARLVGQGTIDSGGRKVDTKTFETACDNGLGYFVISSDAPDAFSCFAAEATRDKDVAAGRQPGIVCTLPTNTDTKAMATAMLAHTGANCRVSKVRWIGLSAKASTEYTETACSEGSGYVLTSPAPGSHSPVTALACAEAAKRGIFCTMSATALPAFTVQTFRDELARHKIVCSASDDNIRHVGQETTRKRHVVEFKCAEFPKGVVAYIPLADSTAPFELADCPTATKHGVTCELQH